MPHDFECELRRATRIVVRPAFIVAWHMSPNIREWNA